MLAFDEDIGLALGKACEQDSDSDAVHFARAAQIVRRCMFNSKPFTGSFEENCQSKSVPHSLLALVSMVLEGPCIKNRVIVLPKQHSPLPRFRNITVSSTYANIQPLAHPFGTAQHKKHLFRSTLG